MKKVWKFAASLFLAVPLLALSAGVGDEVGLVYLNTPAGEKLLDEASDDQDFLPLAIQYEVQKNLAYCGPASCVMVLNAIGVEAPETGAHRDYRFFTQDNLFSEKAERVISADTVKKQGMTLAELAGVLRANGVEANAVHAEDDGMDAFRRQARSRVKRDDEFVLINYLRSSIDQKTGGHISPLAAYDADSDRFLILDVSRYKYPPVWVETEALFKAMATKDSTSAKNRGYVLVRK